MKKTVILMVLMLLFLPLAGADFGSHHDTSSEVGLEQNSGQKVSEEKYSDFEPKTFSYQGTATAFTSPDSSRESIMQFLDSVNSSLDIGIYQFTDLKIAQKVANLSRDGVSVRVLAEGEPVQGMPQREIASLNFISRESGDVRLIGGDENSPYEYYHPKFMIRDNSSVFLTSENFVPSSFPSDPSYGTRGWGIILEDESLASYYGEVFDHDWNLGEDFDSQDVEYERYDLDPGNYSSEFNGTKISGEFELTPVLVPDTNMDNSTVLNQIRNADESIYLQQHYIVDWEEEENPYLQAVKEAAKRGVEVKILLDSSWYNLEGNGNDEMIDELNDFAVDEEVDLEARLLSDYHGLIKTHNKGMIVDGDSVMVSTINWNANSMLRNREVGVIVENSEIGDYYSDVFLKDWNDFIYPIADAGDEKNVESDDEVILSGENSWDDHEIVEYRWDMDGDGTIDRKGEEIAVKFEEEGTYTITLTVEDVGGNTDTDSIEVEVEKEEEDMVILGKILDWIILLSPAVLITSFLFKELWLNRS